MTVGAVLAGEAPTGREHDRNRAVLADHPVRHEPAGRLAQPFEPLRAGTDVDPAVAGDFLARRPEAQRDDHRGPRLEGGVDPKVSAALGGPAAPALAGIPPADPRISCMEKVAYGERVSATCRLNSPGLAFRKFINLK